MTGHRTLKGYSEMAIYSPKVTSADYERFFHLLIQEGMPSIEWLDRSRFFSLRGMKLLLKRRSNTIKLYAWGRGGIHSQHALLFPFRLGPPQDLEVRAKGIPRKIKFLGGARFFDFLIKENVCEIRLRVVRLFGKFFGLGSFFDEGGGTGMLFLTTPQKFFEIDLENSPLFYIELLDPIPKTLSIHSEEPAFESEGARIGLDNFDPLQHSLIVGTSGSGKSKLIEILAKAIRDRHADSRIVVIDPHGEFSRTFRNEKVVNFIDNYIEPFDVGTSKSPLITQLVSQLITSTIQQENRYSERVVFYSVHLLASLEKLTLENLNLLLTDETARMGFVSGCPNDEIRRFFDQEFQDIYVHHFDDAVLPITNFIGEYMLYLGGEKRLESLTDLIGSNRVTIVSFNPHHFGRRIIKFFAGAIVNQMYMLAISERLKQPTVLVVDEFPTVETKVAKDILAETRKFNLYLHVSVQYLGQVSKHVLDAIISNTRNIVSFKATKEDAKLLSSMMEIKMEEFFKRHVSPSELEESKKEMFVKLQPRECIVRLFDGKRYLLPMKVRTVEASRWT